jgi:SAM-dependent methyltransferase
MRLNPYSGDGRLRVDQAAAYLLLNAVDNMRAHAHVDPGLSASRFVCPTAVDELRAVDGTPSPSRALCDLFWTHLPWAALQDRLGPIEIADLGCGSGAYAERFQNWSGGRVVRYIGVDLRAHPRWEMLAATLAFAEFTTGDIEQIDALLPSSTNVIVSQSTLEHVRDDAAVFERLHAFAHASGRPLLQLHAVPSAACLRLYLWHGYRQYTPRTLSPLTREFADCSTRRLIALGGDACNALHWTYVTWPVMIRRTVDRRDTDADGYRRALAAAVAEDMARAPRHPTFYVVLLYSNGHRPLPPASCWSADEPVNVGT